MTAVHLFAFLGEPTSPTTTDLDVARAVERGLPVSTVRRLTTSDPEEGGLTPEEIERLVIPRRTLSKRRARRQRLTLEESNRLARAARVLAAALQIFGGDSADRTTERSRAAARRAARWLRRPHRALDGQVPLALLTTDAGARLVEDALGRIEYGVFA